MKKSTFAELVESIHQAGKIRRGEAEPSRRFVVNSKEDVLTVRQSFNVSQSQFASFIGVSLGTLQNWEQGRRHPTGAARVLIAMAMRHPKIFADEFSHGSTGTDPLV